MRKLKLDLDRLTVESFDTRAVSAERGTVKGHYETNEFASCLGTCQNTCACPTKYTQCMIISWDETECLCPGPIESAERTACNNCQQSVNEMGTCIAPSCR